jgi:hypothetical protein
LYAYTLARGDGEFIHQHVVDAYAAQHVTQDTKVVTLAAALIGLYLFVERGYNGREVQLEHMKLGKRMKSWPRFEAPRSRAELTVGEPWSTPPGPERDEKIRKWAREVWEMWGEHKAEVEALYQQRLRG